MEIELEPARELEDWHHEHWQKIQNEDHTFTRVEGARRAYLAAKAAREKLEAGGEMTMENEIETVCGKTVQHDESGGQGHCWRNTAREDIPANVALELEGEIIDGGKDSCEDFVASNGQHYRW